MDSSPLIVGGCALAGLLVVGAGAWATYQALTDGQSPQKNGAAKDKPTKKEKRAKDDKARSASPDRAQTPDPEAGPIDGDEDGGEDAAVRGDQERGSLTSLDSIDAGEADVVPVVSVPTLPNGKENHFYVSYQKIHTTLRKIPERQVADLQKYLKRCGFVGKVSASNAKGKAFVEAQQMIRSSCALIVWFHDETVDSTRCVMEWETALEAGLPILCLVDTGRHMLDEIQGPVYLLHEYFNKKKWIDYRDEDSASVFEKVTEWLKSNQASGAEKTNLSRGLTISNTLSKAGFGGMGIVPGSIADSESDESDGPAEVAAFHLPQEVPMTANMKKSKLLIKAERKSGKKSKR